MPSSKRQKTNKENGTVSTEKSSKKRAGRLSVLPSLPLDILFEIFGHLLPGDLIQLTRTNKSFRSVLLSRQSISVWRQVLQYTVEDGHPPCPEGMSEPAWAALVWGGPWCSHCGARSAAKILWHIRRRLCKKCCDQHLVPLWNHTFEGRPWSEILPCDIARTKRSLNGDQLHAWEADETELNLELEIQLKENASKPIRTVIHLILDDRKSNTADRLEHAVKCRDFETLRKRDRRDEIHEQKSARSDLIKARLLEAGHDARDVNHHLICNHKDVYVAKPLSDRVWKNLAPILTELVESVRDRRLAYEKRERLLRRIQVVEDCMPEIFPLVAPSSISFLPSGLNIMQVHGLAELLSEDEEPSDELRKSILDRLPTVLPEFQLWISTRAQDISECLDVSWPTASFDSSLEPKAVSDDRLNCTSTTAALDLAVYVFKCSKSSEDRLIGLWLFGMDALAHAPCWACKVEPDLTPDPKGHAIVLKILEFHHLEPSRTRPVDLEILAGRYTCDGCPTVKRGAHVLYNWRTAVWSHHDNQHCDASRLRLLTTFEDRFIDAYSSRRSWRYAGSELGKSLAWGCNYCYLPWTSLSDVQEHLLNVHNVESAAEDRDYIFNRKITRSMDDLPIPELPKFVAGNTTLDVVEAEATSLSAPVS
ncbi:hypothetical protein PENSPDRAFT_751909 [Peniophora sp. CONT]|nr:hypothetical protein PENSPDRAFT_751909 [Peniophora sp. CONT]